MILTDFHDNNHSGASQTVAGSKDPEFNDVVLINDREVLGKGKFTLGIIESVKVDNDGLVRKVVVKCKVKPNTTTLFKHVERNVGFSVVVNKDVDNDCQESEQVDDENETITEDDEDKDEVTTRNDPKTNDSKMILPSSSTGRKRWLPNKFSN